MYLKGVNVRPMRREDVDTFEGFRREYLDGDLELPKGWGGAGWESAVAEGAGGHQIASLTGTLSLVLDPLVRNPRIRSGPELVASIYALERTLAYRGQQLGAVDAYIAIPDHLTEYHEIVRKAGYVDTLAHCKVFRRPLMPDTHPLIGEEMEAKRRLIIDSASRASDPAPTQSEPTPVE